MTTWIEERLPFWKKKAVLIPFHFNLPAESTWTCLDLAARAVYIVLQLLIVIYWSENSYEDIISTAMLGLRVCASFCPIDVEQKVHVQLNLLYVNSFKLHSFVWTLCYVNFINITLFRVFSMSNVSKVYRKFPRCSCDYSEKFLRQDCFLLLNCNSSDIGPVWKIKKATNLNVLYECLESLIHVHWHIQSVK